jgi:hypothetical protein
VIGSSTKAVQQDEHPHSAATARIASNGFFMVVSGQSEFWTREDCR